MRVKSEGERSCMHASDTGKSTHPFTARQQDRQRPREQEGTAVKGVKECRGEGVEMGREVQDECPRTRAKQGDHPDRARKPRVTPGDS